MAGQREALSWTEDDEIRSALWHSESGAPPPQRVVVADDHTTADVAYRLACEGTAIVWRGDFQNARQLLTAMARRVDRRRGKTATSPAQSFHLYRQSQAQRARTLGMLLVPFDAGQHAIYDPASRMLRAFLARLADHLEPGGEGLMPLS